MSESAKKVKIQKSKVKNRESSGVNREYILRNLFRRRMREFCNQPFAQDFDSHGHSLRNKFRRTSSRFTPDDSRFLTFDF